MHTISLKRVFSFPKKRCAQIRETGFVSDPILNWVNHSCNPNVVLRLEKKQPELVALRDIFPGEEIVCDYTATEQGHFKKKCNCGSSNCKGFFVINV